MCLKRLFDFSNYNINPRSSLQKISQLFVNYNHIRRKKRRKAKWENKSGKYDWSVIVTASMRAELCSHQQFIWAGV